jgi:hypothetical protein
MTRAREGRPDEAIQRTPLRGTGGRIDYPTRYPLCLYAGSSILLGSEGTVSDRIVVLLASV